MGARKSVPPREDKVQRASKQAKTGQKGTERVAEKRSDPQVRPLAWLPAPILNREPFLANASIRSEERRVGKEC